MLLFILQFSSVLTKCFGPNWPKLPHGKDNSSTLVENNKQGQTEQRSQVEKTTGRYYRNREATIHGLDK
jgi:hypothetical protein